MTKRDPKADLTTREGEAVKRYSQHDLAYYDMQESEDGEWVRWSDVEFQTQERDGLRALLRELLDCKLWDSGLPGRFLLVVPEPMYALIEKAVKVKP